MAACQAGQRNRELSNENVLAGVPDVRRDVSIRSVYIFNAFRRQDSAGTVYDVTHRETAAKYACKLYRKEEPRQLSRTETQSRFKTIAQEVRILTNPKMMHKNIIRLKEVFEDAEYVYMVTERCGEELMKKVAQLTTVSERNVANWLLPFAKAVNHAHRNGVVHVDVRLDHVLLHVGLVKLGGFDSSQSYSDDNGFANKAGMPMFCAPEVLGKQSNHLANMWSLGVSLAVLLTGKIPFTSEEDIRCGNLDFNHSSWMGTSQAAQDTVKGLVKVSPEDRTPVDQLLQSSWLNGAASDKPISGLAERLRVLSEDSPNGCLDQSPPPKPAALLPGVTSLPVDSTTLSPTSSPAAKKAKASGYAGIDRGPNLPDAFVSPNPSTPCLQPLQDRTNMGRSLVRGLTYESPYDPILLPSPKEDDALRALRMGPRQLPFPWEAENRASPEGRAKQACSCVSSFAVQQQPSSTSAHQTTLAVSPATAQQWFGPSGHPAPASNFVPVEVYDQQAAGVALAAGLIQQQASDSEHEHDDKTEYSDSELASNEQTQFSDSEPEQEFVDSYSEPEGEPEPVPPQHQVQSSTAKLCLQCGTADTCQWRRAQRQAYKGRWMCNGCGIKENRAVAAGRLI